MFVNRNREHIKNRHVIDLMQSQADYVWTLVVAVLMYFMQAGFTHIGGASIKLIDVQVIGMAACFLWVFPVAFLLYKRIGKTVGWRVSREEQIEGLDCTEHGGNAYPDLEVNSIVGLLQVWIRS